MSIRNDYDELLPDRPLPETSDPELTATATDHTRVRSGSFGVSIDEAAQREDVILDHSLGGVWRPTTPDDVITKDTVRAFDIGGGIVTDMTLAEAHNAGLLPEWNDDWGDIQERPDFTEDELREIEQQHGSQAKHGSDVREGFHEDTPLEAANLILEADIHGVPRNDMLALADDISVGPDGRVQLGDRAKDFLSAKFGMSQSAADVAQGVFDAWTKIANETIGQDAVRSIGLAARYNPEAAKDIEKAQKRALIGILSREDLRTLQEKWSR